MNTIQPVCICSLRYPSRNAHALYYHLRPTPLAQNFFSHFSINGTISKIVTEHRKCVSSFSTTFSEIYFNSKTN